MVFDHVRGSGRVNVSSLQLLVQAGGRDQLRGCATASDVMHGLLQMGAFRRHLAVGVARVVFRALPNPRRVWPGRPGGGGNRRLPAGLCRGPQAQS